jgi:putative PIN family toxin of toxin-antitoxin system
VLDTNILVSAAMKPDGLQRTVYLLSTTNPARLYVSQAIVAEYREVLARRELRIPKGIQQQFLQRIRSNAHVVFPSRQIRVTEDPDDNIFLECADSAGADYLITGNQRHFPEFWKKTKIVTSREFVTLVARHLNP